MITNKNILALDPAATCGWAHSNGRGGVWQVGATDKRLVDMERRLVMFCNTNTVKMIACENASFGSPNPNVQAMHNELLGVIKLVAARRGIDVVTFRPNQIKMYATNRGNATKEQMMRACVKHLKINPIDDNHADALWCLSLPSGLTAGLRELSHDNLSN